MRKAKSLIDVVLVSDAKNSFYKSLTCKAIDTVGKLANIIIVESNKDIFYNDVITVHPDEKFNYNRYLNIGASYGTADYIFFGNNDIIFSFNWEKKIIKAMKRLNISSASPLCPRVAKIMKIKANSGVLIGYELITRFCGWAFVWKRELYNQIGPLDEDFTFWCSDNACIEQLLNANEQHGLVTSSLVGHFGSLTLESLDPTLRQKYTLEEIDKFEKKYNKNLRNSPHLKV